MRRNESLAGHIGDYYFWAGVRIAVATGVVVVLLRPVYLFGLCGPYVEYHEERDRKLELPVLPSTLVSAVVAFLALALFAAVVFQFRQEIGLTDWIARPLRGTSRLQTAPHAPPEQCAHAQAHVRLSRSEGPLRSSCDFCLGSGPPVAWRETNGG